MSVMLITSVSPSGNLVTTKKYQDSDLFEYITTTTATTTNNDISMTKNIGGNGQIASIGNIENINFSFAEDDDKSTYSYNFTINKSNVTETNANIISNLKNTNLISTTTSTSTSTTSSSSSSALSSASSLSSSSSSSSSFFSRLKSSSTSSELTPESNNINMQHNTTVCPRAINTIKKSLAISSSRRSHDNDSDTKTSNKNSDSNNNSISGSPLKPSVLGSQPKSNDRCAIISDDIIKSQRPLCLRKQPSPSKYQRLKRTLSLSKKSDKEEKEENTISFNSLCSIVTTPLDIPPAKENCAIHRLSRSFTMNCGSSNVKSHPIDTTNNDVDNNHNNTKGPLNIFSRSMNKNNSSDLSLPSKSQNNNKNNNDSQFTCNKYCARKRTKSNSTHHCTPLSTLPPILPLSPLSPLSPLPSSPLSSSLNDSPTETSSQSSNLFLSDNTVLEAGNTPNAAVKERNSMDDQTEHDIRRSWSHIEVRHIKGLFKRNRHVSDVQRRNSYAYPTSLRTNKQIASDSEYNVMNHVHDKSPDPRDNEQSSPKKFPVDIYALQADMEKETDVVTRSRQMRKFIISEIYTTEQSYLSHMRTLKKTFVDPCIGASTTPPLMNKDDVKIIFAHIDDLIKLSDIIVQTLETSMDPWEDYDSKMGEVFLRFAKDFEVFEKYAENIQKSRQLLAKKANQSVFYRKYVSSLRKKENIKLGLNDYMIMPIQRVTRYALLLRELKKYTSETHSDYNDLCKALDNMVSLATQCNNNIA